MVDSCTSKLLGHWLILTLKRPNKINVLNLEMIEFLLKHLKEASENPKVKAIFLHGEGERGLCAGGDVVSVVEGQKEGRPYDFFFKREYELDLLIHEFSKPVVVYGHGFTMGGGIGLLMGGALKILGPNSTLAMPEVHIGLFPDVGASYFLGKLPRNLKLFLAMTGAHFNESDAIDWGLIDFVIEKDKIFELLNENISFKDLKQKLADQNITSVGVKNDWQEFIENLSFEGLLEFEKSLSTLKNERGDNKQFKSLLGFFSASPLSKVLIWEYFNLSQSINVRDSFRFDLKCARYLSAFSDFHEGVRAQLIDKDKNPKWSNRNTQEALIQHQSAIKKIFKTS